MKSLRLGYALIRFQRGVLASHSAYFPIQTVHFLIGQLLLGAVFLRSRNTNIYEVSAYWALPKARRAHHITPYLIGGRPIGRPFHQSQKMLL